MLGSQTQVVDGQRFSMPSPFQYNPSGYGAQTTGLPQVSPTMPPFIGASNGAGSSLGGAEGVGGYGTAGNNAQVTQVAADHPHNLKVSPVWWAVLMLVAGLTLLNVIHWRTLEGGDESVHVGSAHESASEAA